MKTQQSRSVLILGGAGFIGSNLAQHLLETTNAVVHVFDNIGRAGVHRNLEWLRRISAGSGRLRVTFGDVRDYDLVETAVRQAGEVYHFAAQVAVTTSIIDPRLDFEVNLAGTFNVLDAVRRCGHNPFLVFTSTNKVYGDTRLGLPVAREIGYTYRDHKGISEKQRLHFQSPYGCSKGAADQYVLDFARIYGVSAVVFRMSCVAGPRQFGTEDQGWVAHFVYSALERRPVSIYGDGHQVRDVLCVYDLVRAFDLVRSRRGLTAGQVYNVGGGAANGVSLLELIERIERQVGHRLEYVMERRRPGDQQVYLTDYRKLERHTGWRPEIGVDKTIELLRQFWEDNQRAVRGPRPIVAKEAAATTHPTGRAA